MSRGAWKRLAEPSRSFKSVMMSLGASPYMSWAVLPSMSVLMKMHWR
jgi:hypothetical protein